MDTSYLFDYLPQRRGTGCLKWDTYDVDVLPMWVADMDFIAPEPILRALHQRVGHGVFGYPEAIHGDPHEAAELRLIIVEWLSKRYDWQVQPDELVFVPGVVTAFNLACKAFAMPGDGVLVQTPVYPPILRAPLNSSMERQENQLVQSSDNHYQVELQAFDATVSEQTRLFILCNPHNPIGKVFQWGELESMAEICLRHKVVICSDEIHCDLVYKDHQHIPIATIDKEVAENTITLMAPSKSFNLPGLNFSFAVIQNPNLRVKFQKAGKGLVGWINVMGWVAARAAYQECQGWLDNLLRYLQGNRDFVCEYVNTQFPGISAVEPEGTYLAWLDCRETGIQGNPHEFFLNKARVALNDGASFGSGGDGFVRLNFGCPRAMLSEALQRMKDALDALRPSVYS